MKFCVLRKQQFFDFLTLTQNHFFTTVSTAVFPFPLFHFPLAMLRRTVLKSLLGALAAGFVMLGGSLGFAAEKFDASTLKKRLQTRTKAQEAFVDRVVELVAEKKLSEKSLRAAYSTAMKNRSNRFAYFSAAIRKLAKDEGVTL